MVILNHKISQQYALKTKIGCLTENKSINQYFKYLILCILITFILSSQYIFSIINYYQIKKQVQLICNEKVYFLNSIIYRNANTTEYYNLCFEFYNKISNNKHSYILTNYLTKIFFQLKEIITNKTYIGYKTLNFEIATFITCFFVLTVFLRKNQSISTTRISNNSTTILINNLNISDFSKYLKHNPKADPLEYFKVNNIKPSGVSFIYKFEEDIFNNTKYLSILNKIYKVKSYLNILNTLTKFNFMKIKYKIIKEIYDSNSKHLKDINNSLIKCNNYNPNYITNQLFLIFESNNDAQSYFSLFDTKSTPFYKIILNQFFISKNENYESKVNIPFNLLGISVSKPIECSDIIWENFSIDIKIKRTNIIISILSSIVIISISFLSILIITIIQIKLKQKNNKIYNYIISIILAVFNNLIRKRIELLTKNEKKNSYSNEYLSLFYKIALINVFNTNIIPYFCFLLFKSNTMFLNTLESILITNILLFPIINLINIPLIVKIVKLNLIKLTNRKFFGIKTQTELNQLYEYPQINLYDKYSHILKTLVFSILYSHIIERCTIIICTSYVILYIVEQVKLKYFYSNSPELTIEFYKTNLFYVFIFIFSFNFGRFIIDYRKGDGLSNFHLILVVMFITIYLLKAFEVYDIVELKEDFRSKKAFENQIVQENLYVMNNPVLKNISEMKKYCLEKMSDIISTEIDSGSTRI